MLYLYFATITLYGLLSLSRALRAYFFIMIPNKAFTKSKELVLDDNYVIKPHNVSGIMLIFTEERTRTREIDGKPEKYIFKDTWYFTRIAQALRMYTDLEMVDLESIEDLIEKSERIYKLIDQLDKTFKQF